MTPMSRILKNKELEITKLYFLKLENMILFLLSYSKKIYFPKIHKEFNLSSTLFFNQFIQIYGESDSNYRFENSVLAKRIIFQRNFFLISFGLLISFFAIRYLGEKYIFYILHIYLLMRLSPTFLRRRYFEQKRKGGCSYIVLINKKL